MPITYIAKDFVEGAGSLYQKYLFTFLYAIGKDDSYIHTPAKLYKRHYQDSDLERMENLWELIFSPITSCINQGNSPNVSAPLSNIPFDISYKFIKNMNVSRREKLLRIVRNKFSEAFDENNLKPKQTQNQFTIAVHLRSLGVGDIVFFKNYTYPWQYFNHNYGLSDNCPEYYGKLYSKAVNDCIKYALDKSIVVHIHSTASIEELGPLISRIDPKVEIKFCGEQLAPLAFIDMIHADILIASHSSFSWLALLLRKKPSKIRKGFRYILPENVTLLDEVLYEGIPLVKRPRIFLKKVYDYSLFYPEYFFNQIRSRIYF
jgi:hypothetical protein